MTIPGPISPIDAKLEAALAEHRQSLSDIAASSAERAARGTAAVQDATKRFQRLVERVQQGNRERNQTTKNRDQLAPDDPLAALETQATDLDGSPPDPFEPTDAEVEYLVDTLKPLPPPKDTEPEDDEPQADTSLRQWSQTKEDDAPAEESSAAGNDLDDDFEDPW